MVNKKIQHLLACGFMAIGIASSANAHIATMYYDSFGGFIEGTQSTTIGGAGVTFRGARDPHDDNNIVIGDGNDSWSDMSWGTATGAAGPYGGQSGAELARYDDQSVQTESGILVEFGDMIHHNEPISSAGVTNVDISWNLHLYGNATDAANNTNIIFDWHQHFNMDFWETLNSGTCPNTAAAGTEVGVGVNPENHYISDGNPQSVCDDGFAFHPLSPSTTSFEYQGELYEVVVSGFYPNGILTETFWSEEGQANTGYVRFEIKSVEVPSVPVPVMNRWALMAMVLAMAGVAIVYSRKRLGKHLNT